VAAVTVLDAAGRREGQAKLWLFGMCLRSHRRRSPCSGPMSDWHGQLLVVHLCVTSALSCESMCALGVCWLLVCAAPTALVTHTLRGVWSMPCSSVLF
jgi:hypothetical protein